MNKCDHESPCCDECIDKFREQGRKEVYAGDWALAKQEALKEVLALQRELLQALQTYHSGCVDWKNCNYCVLINKAKRDNWRTLDINQAKTPGKRGLNDL